MPKPLHHPPHVFLDDTWYAITGSIYQRRRLLEPPGHKELIRDQLKALVPEFDLRLAAWVVLDNHYHILVKSETGAKLSRFFGRLHGRTSFELNGRDGKRGRQVWHNFWDTCIRDEKDYWVRFNYIHHNPVKHGYVAQPVDWRYSSYRYYLEHYGEEWLSDVLCHYPIIAYSDSRDQFG